MMVAAIILRALAFCPPRVCAVALTVLSLAVCGEVLVSAAEPSPARYEFTEPQMGVPFKIVLYAPGDEAANLAAAAAYARVSALNAILSDYEDDSELSRLSRGSPHAEPVRVSDDLWNVLCTRPTTLKGHGRRV